MSRIFLCSDPHFYHDKLIKHRGFDSVDEYHSMYIENWNNVVSKRDVVYMLGDITMEVDHYDILDKLNGIKHVILGNHDVKNRSHLESLMKHCNKILVCKKLEYEGIPVSLTHIPIHPIEFEFKLKYNIHGHLHDINIDDERYINICPEQIGYTPVLFDDIMKKVIK